MINKDLAKAEKYFFKGEYEIAQRICRRYDMSENPKDAAFANYLLAQIAARKDRRGNFQEAMSHYTRTIELDPNFSDAYLGRGGLSHITAHELGWKHKDDLSPEIDEMILEHLENAERDLIDSARFAPENKNRASIVTQRLTSVMASIRYRRARTSRVA